MPLTHKTPSGETPSKVGHQLVDHDFSFFFCLDEACRGGTPVSWQNIHIEKNSKNPKKTPLEKKSLFFPPHLNEKGTKSP